MGSLSKVGQMDDEAGSHRMSAPGEPNGASGHAMEAPNELWEWLRLLNRRKALIIGAGLLAVALMALIIAQQTPMYKASARIMLDTRTFPPVKAEAALSGVDSTNMGAIQSELEVIQSEFLIGRVVDRLGLATNPEFNGTKPPGFLDSSLAPIRELWHSGIASLLAPVQPKPPQTATTPARGRSDDSDPGRRAAIGTVA